MEVHDFDEEHLRAVLKDEGHDEADEDIMNVQESGNSAMIRLSEDVSARLANGDEIVEDKQVCLERYRLLPEYARNSFLWKESSGDAHPTASENLQEHKNNAPSSSAPKDCQEVPVVEEEKFALSEQERMFLPDGMITPHTKRLNEMIRMTAVRTSSAPQLEVLLKVKQADNVEFAFLQPGNSLNPYYILLKERGGKLEARPASGEEAGVKHNEGMEDSLVDYPSSSEDKETGGTMGGLLGMYASSSDDSDDEEKAEKAATKSDNPEVSSESGERVKGVPADTDDEHAEASIAATNDRPSCTDERKAKRLKRAKLMKGHFALKLMDK